MLKLRDCPFSPATVGIREKKEAEHGPGLRFGELATPGGATALGPTSIDYFVIVHGHIHTVLCCTLYLVYSHLLLIHPQNCVATQTRAAVRCAVSLSQPAQGVDHQSHKVVGTGVPPRVAHLWCTEISDQ